MANTASALKNVRRIKTRTRQNNFWRAKIKAALKSLSKNADKNKAQELLQQVQSVLDKAAKRNVMHKNKASRLVSRVFRKV